MYEDIYVYFNLQMYKIIGKTRIYNQNAFPYDLYCWLIDFWILLIFSYFFW
jgi:hypothetical protein